MQSFEQHPLSAAEARVLATLMEKARTVPDSYPLTLNSLQTGCNQKSSREPVMDLSEHEIAQALDGLRQRTLVFETSGGRAVRYEHNAERWHRFADIGSVEAFLEELQDRPADKGGPLVVKLPRAPGAREQRWAHLLCGPVDMSALAAAPQARPASAGGPDLAALLERIEALEAQVLQLQQRLDAVGA